MSISNTSFQNPLVQKAFYITRYVYESFSLTYGVDKRSLALFRILLGLTICYDIWDRSNDAKAHYSDFGIIDRQTSLESFSMGYHFNAYLMAGAPEVVKALMGVHFFLSILMTIGFWTKTTTFFTWILTISLIHRNIPVFHGGDMYIRCLLFLSFWLPCESFYSYDQTFYYSKSIKKRRREDNLWQCGVKSRGQTILMYSENSNSSIMNTLKGELYRILQACQDRHYLHVSGATVAITVQVFCLYYFSYFFKTGDPWKVDHTATYLALQLDFFRLPLGDFLLQFPEICKFMTRSVLYWEWLGPLLLIFPFPPFIHPLMRLFVSFSLCALHLGFGLSLRLETFFWISETGVAVTLPSLFWDYFIFYQFKSLIIWLNNNENSIKNRKQCLFFTIYYNSNCKFCENLSRILTDFLLFPETRVLSHPKKIDENIQYSTSTSTSTSDSTNTTPTTAITKNVELEVDKGWLVVDSKTGKSYTGYDAFLKIIQYCPYFFLLYHPLNHYLARTIFTGFPRSTHFTHSPSSPNSLHSSDDFQHPDAYEVFHSQDRISTFFHPIHDLDCMIEQEFFTNESSKSSSGSMGGISNIIWKKWLRPKKLFNLFILIFILNLIPLFFTLHVINANQIYRNPGSDVFPPHVPTGLWTKWGKSFFLDQYWAMFAPKPPDSHWYYVIEAIKVNGDITELWKNQGMFKWEGAPLSWDKPNPFPPSVGNHRWFKFYENGINLQSRNRILLPRFGAYICQEWNSRHTYRENVWTFKIYVFWERQKLDGTREPPSKHMLWHHVCFQP